MWEELEVSVDHKVSLRQAGGAEGEVLFASLNWLTGVFRAKPTKYCQSPIAPVSPFF